MRRSGALASPIQYPPPGGGPVRGSHLGRVGKGWPRTPGRTTVNGVALPAFSVEPVKSPLPVSTIPYTPRKVLLTRLDCLRSASISCVDSTIPWGDDKKETSSHAFLLLVPFIFSRIHKGVNNSIGDIISRPLGTLQEIHNFRPLDSSDSLGSLGETPSSTLSYRPQTY